MINVVVSDPNLGYLLWKGGSIADAAAGNSNDIKTFLVKSLSTFFIKDKPVFSNDSKILRRNPLDCPILWNWFFEQN